MFLVSFATGTKETKFNFELTIFLWIYAIEYSIIVFDSQLSHLECRNPLQMTLHIFNLKFIVQSLTVYIRYYFVLVLGVQHSG